MSVWPTFDPACSHCSAPEVATIIDAKGAGVTLRADTDARIVLLGGAPIDGERHIWWNFVSSSKAQIGQAKLDWEGGRFPTVPGDEAEFMPLPK